MKLLFTKGIVQSRPIDDRWDSEGSLTSLTPLTVLSSWVTPWLSAPLTPFTVFWQSFDSVTMLWCQFWVRYDYKLLTRRTFFRVKLLFLFLFHSWTTSRPLDLWTLGPPSIWISFFVWWSLFLKASSISNMWMTPNVYDSVLLLFVKSTLFTLYKIDVAISMTPYQIKSLSSTLMIC